MTFKSKHDNICKYNLHGEVYSYAIKKHPVKERCYNVMALNRKGNELFVAFEEVDVESACDITSALNNPLNHTHN